ncbi:MAG: HAMP domain-containing histidine kinase [Verrucomicrobia bacterium]|nr:HAMP domain-containing histidine kinase [Verrucomicrobiota bacterium]
MVYASSISRLARQPSELASDPPGLHSWLRHLAHDVENPLAVIRMAAEAAVRESLSPAERRVLGRRIQRQVDRIHLLIQEWLVVAGEDGRVGPRPMVDIELFQRRIWESLEPDLGEGRIELRQEAVAPRLRVRIEVRPLTCALRQLYLNALEAMSGAGVWVWSIQTEGQRVRLDLEMTVSDGEAEGLHRFLDGLLPDAPSGSGAAGFILGSRILASHQGQLEAVSRPAGGRLSVWLPLASSAELSSTCL